MVSLLMYTLLPLFMIATAILGEWKAFSIVVVVAFLFWVVGARRHKQPVNERLTAVIKEKLTDGTFSMAEAVKIARQTEAEDTYREQFLQVVAIISSADGYPASKEAMNTIRSEYPAFSEAARHLQIIGESIAIVEKTKVRATLESRIDVIRKNQTAMFDALPFDIDQDARDKQVAGINEMLKDGLDRLAALPKPVRKKKATP